jgi:ribosomal protein S18 acetylase RimI-like enzyme
VVQIRRARAEDSARLAELSEVLGYRTASDDVLRRFVSLDRNPEYWVLVAVDDGVVGFISFHKYETVFKDPGINITALVVDEERQNQGIGRLLVRQAEEIARANGFTWIRANSGMHRTEAHGFYRRLGFDSEKDQKRFLKELN